MSTRYSAKPKAIPAPTLPIFTKLAKCKFKKYNDLIDSLCYTKIALVKTDKHPE
jgi:hypothetical protein